MLDLLSLQFAEGEVQVMVYFFVLEQEVVRVHRSLADLCDLLIQLAVSPINLVAPL